MGLDELRIDFDLKCPSLDLDSIIICIALLISFSEVVLIHPRPLSYLMKGEGNKGIRICFFNICIQNSSSLCY